MRWCSRSAAGEAWVSGVAGRGATAIRLECSPKNRSPEQAASASAANRTISVRAVPRMRCAGVSPASRLRPNSLPRSPCIGVSFISDDLDLLGRRCLDPRTAALLDPSPHHDAASRQLLRLQSGGRKYALMTLRNGDREILAPAPAEIHIDGAAALAHRHHLALDQREAPPFGGDLPRILGRMGKIARIGPKAKPAGAGRALRGAQLGRAGGVARARRYPGKALRQQGFGNRTLSAVAAHIG